MPTYNYMCSECDNIQEESHPMSGPNWKIECRVCNSRKVKKTFLNATAPGVIFNGPGWCTNDDKGK